MRLKSRQIKTDLIILDDDTELEVPFAPSLIMEYRDLLIERSDSRIKIGYLVDDYEYRGDYFKEYDQGEFIDLGDVNFDYYYPEDDEDTRSPVQIYIDGLEAKHPGRVFPVSKHEHGLVQYWIGNGGGDIWDTTRGRYIYIAPDDTPDPAKCADAVMKEFTDYCNGNIYGVVVATYEKNEADEWEEVEHDSCWGFIGDDHAYDSLKNDYF